MMALDVEVEKSKFVVAEEGGSSPSKADNAADVDLSTFVREFISMSMAVARERDRLLVEIEVKVIVFKVIWLGSRE